MARASRTPACVVWRPCRCFRRNQDRGQVRRDKKPSCRITLTVKTFGRLQRQSHQYRCDQRHFTRAGRNGADDSLVVVSRAPLLEITPFKRRMGWRFRWVSSFGSDFDYHVSFTEKEIATGKIYYNYEMTESQERGTARHKCVLQGREWRNLPHLFLICARRGPVNRHIQLPRPDSSRSAGREGSRNGLGCASMTGMNCQRVVRLVWGFLPIITEEN